MQCCKYILVLFAQLIHWDEESSRFSDFWLLKKSLFIGNSNWSQFSFRKRFLKVFCSRLPSINLKLRFLFHKLQISGKGDEGN